MITQMKKITFLVTNKEYDQFIDGIRKLGVVHVDQLQSGATSEEFEASKALSERFKNALKELDYAVDSYKVDRTFTAISPASLNHAKLGAEAQSQVEQVESLVSREQDVKRQIEATEKNIKALEPWGEFDFAQVRELEQHGYKVSFFACPNKMFQADWVDQYFATVISEVEKKIYFVMKLGVFLRKRVVVEMIPLGNQHLRRDVFVEIPEIHMCFVAEELLVDVIFHEIAIQEHQGHEKPRIRKEELELCKVEIRRHPHVRIIGVMRDEHCLGILHFRDEFQDVFGTMIFQDARYLIASRILRKLCRNGAENHGRLARPINLFKICGIQRKDGPLDVIDFSEIVRFEIIFHRLRHPADKHIDAELLDELPVDSVCDGFPLCEHRSEEFWHSILPRRKTKFLKVHRRHFHPRFFARDEDVFHVLADGNQ